MEMLHKTSTLALALLLTAFFGSQAAAAEPGPAKTKITIAEYGEYPLYTVLYTAEAMGHFATEGLEVTIVPAGGDEKVFASLLSGDAQFGVSDPTFTAISGQRGKPGRVIAAVLQNIPAWGVAKSDKVPEIKSPDQLKPFVVGTFPAPSTSFTLQRRMFQMGKLDPNIREIAYGALLPALEAGRIDIALENEPNVSLAELNGARRVFSLSEYYPQFAFTGLMVLPEYLDQHPEIAQHVVNAFQRSMNTIQNDLPSAIQLTAKRFPNLDIRAIEKALRNCVSAHTFPSDGVVNKSGWDTAIQLRTDVGDLKKTAPYEEYVVTRFAENAKQIR